MSKDKPVTILPDGGPDVTSAGVNWNEVPEFAQHYVAWIDGRHGSAQAALPPIDAEPVPTILHRPTRSPGPVSIGEQDRRGIAMPIATILLGNRHQLLDLGLGQVFPRTPRANCLTFRHGRLKLNHDFSPFRRHWPIPSVTLC